MKRMAMLASAALLLAACAGASNASSSSGGESVVVSTATNAIAMPAPLAASFKAGAPQRIVSLATGVGETLVALGAADRVVGRDETSNVSQLAGVPMMTKSHAVSAEKVLSVQPDLVIIDKQSQPKEAIDQIRSTGVSVVTVPEAWTLAEIGPRTQAVADAVGITNLDLNAYLSALKLDDAPTPGPLKVAFLYLRGTSSIYLLGGKGSGADSLIAAAGAHDVGADAGLDAFTPLTAEALAAMNPDVILVMTKGLESVGGIDGLVELPGVAQTNAGRNRAVVDVDDATLLSFGPRTGEVLDALKRGFAEFSK